MTISHYPLPNSSGVYIKGGETLLWKGERNSNVEIRLVQIAEVEWVYSSSVQLPNGGYGYGPSKSSPPQSTRKDALSIAIKEIERYCTRERQNEGSYSTIVNQILAWCKTLEAKQLELF